MVPENNPALQTAAPSAPEIVPQNFFSRLIGVLFSPGETFREIGRAPNIALPLILLVALFAAVAVISIDRVGPKNLMQKQMQPMIESGWIPQEQAEKMIADAENSATKFKMQGAFNATIFWLVMIFATAGIFKLISLLMSVENNFKQILSVTVYSYLAIGLIYSAVSLVLLYLKSPDEIELNTLVGSNLSALLTMIMGKGSMPGFLVAFTSFIDVFSIWRLTLLAIGYAVVSKGMKIGAAAMWLGGLYFLFALLVSPLMGMFMK